MDKFGANSQMQVKLKIIQTLNNFIYKLKLKNLLKEIGWQNIRIKYAKLNSYSPKFTKTKLQFESNGTNLFITTRS